MALVSGRGMGMMAVLMCAGAALVSIMAIVFVVATGALVCAKMAVANSAAMRRQKLRNVFMVKEIRMDLCLNGKPWVCRVFV